MFNKRKKKGEGCCLYFPWVFSALDKTMCSHHATIPFSPLLKNIYKEKIIMIMSLFLQMYACMHASFLFNNLFHCSPSNKTMTMMIIIIISSFSGRRRFSSKKNVPLQKQLKNTQVNLTISHILQTFFYLSFMMMMAKKHAFCFTFFSCITSRCGL